MEGDLVLYALFVAPPGQLVGHCLKQNIGQDVPLTLADTLSAPSLLPPAMD